MIYERRVWRIVPEGLRSDHSTHGTVLITINGRGIALISVPGSRVGRQDWDWMILFNEEYGLSLLDALKRCEIEAEDSVAACLKAHMERWASPLASGGQLAVGSDAVTPGRELAMNMAEDEDEMTDQDKEKPRRPTLPDQVVNIVDDPGWGDSGTCSILLLLGIIVGVYLVAILKSL